MVRFRELLWKTFLEPNHALPTVISGNSVTPRLVFPALVHGVLAPTMDGPFAGKIGRWEDNPDSKRVPKWSRPPRTSDHCTPFVLVDHPGAHQWREHPRRRWVVRASTGRKLHHPHIFDARLLPQQGDFLKRTVQLRFQSDPGVGAVGRPASGVSQRELGQADHVQDGRLDPGRPSTR
jgi:hypothetical protein